MDAADPLALSARDIRLSYGDGFALRGIDLDLAPDAITAIVGPNGSGKTTLLRVLAGVTEPEDGRVLFASNPLQGLDGRTRARRVGMLPQSPRAPPDLTVRELVTRGRYPHHGPLGRLDTDDRRMIRAALEDADLSDLVDRPLGTLSGGERRRAWIGLALAQRPDVVLLDEPTAHLDLRYATHVLDVVADLRDVHGLAVGIVLHDLNQAAGLADRIVVLDDGAVAASGAPWDVLRPDLIANVFGADVLVEEHPDEQTPLVLTRRNGGPGAPDAPDEPNPGHAPTPTPETTPCDSTPPDTTR